MAGENISIWSWYRRIVYIDVVALPGVYKYHTRLVGFRCVEAICGCGHVRRTYTALRTGTGLAARSPWVWIRCESGRIYEACRVIGYVVILFIQADWIWRDPPCESRIVGSSRGKIKLTC